MARLAGKFAGILLVAVADERAEALVADLTALKDVGLRGGCSSGQTCRPSTRRCG